MEEAQIKNLILCLGPHFNDETKLNAITEFTKQVKLDPNLKRVFATNKGISALVRVLRDKPSPTSPRTYLAAINLLRDLAEKRQYAALMAKKGCCEFLVALLSSPASPYQLDGLRLLHRLSEESPAKACEEGAVAAFTAQLNTMTQLAHAQGLAQGIAHGNALTQDAVESLAVSVAALEFFSRSPNFHSALCGAPCVQPLVAILRLASVVPEGCASSAIGTLANLVSIPEIRTSIAKANGVAPIVEMLKHQNKATRTCALRAVGNLAIDLDIQKTISELNVFPTIVDMLQDSSLQEHAVSAVQNLVYRNQQSQEAVVKAGGLHLLMGMLKTDSTNLKARAALAIFFLVHQKPHQDMASTCIPYLVQLISSNDEKCKLNAIKALGSLANKHPQNKNIILTHNVIPTVLNYLKNASSKREDTTAALGYIAGDPEVDKAIVKEGGLNVLALVMIGTEVEKAAVSETLATLLEPYIDKSSFTPSADKLNSAPQLKKFILDTNANFLYNLQKLVMACELPTKCSAIRLLATFSALNIKFTVDLNPVIEVLNSGKYMECALRLINQSGEIPATQLQAAIPGLNLVLKSADPESATYKLASKYLMLILTDPETVGDVQKTDAIRLIEQFTTTGDEASKHAGIDALWTLLESDVTNEETVVENGGIGLVIAVLESHLTVNSKPGSKNSNSEEINDDILRAALSTVRILAFSYSDQLAQQGVINHLLAVIREKADRQLHSLVLQALWVVLVSGSKIGREMLVKEGGVDLLVNLVGKGNLNAQGKTYAEQCLFLLRAAGYTSLTDEKNYQRKCICPSCRNIVEISKVELLLHTTACNSANEHIVNAKLTNVLLYIKNVPDKLIKDIGSSESWLSFISTIWLQPEIQVISTGLKIFALLVEKGLAIPSQIAIVDTLAAQARYLPRVDDELRATTDPCIRLLHDTSLNNNKDPLLSQLSDLRRHCSLKENEANELRGMIKQVNDQMVQVEAARQVIEEYKSNLNALEERLSKADEILTKTQADKKKYVEDCIELTKKNRDLELENDKLKSHLKEEVTSAEKQRNELKRELQKLRSNKEKESESKKDRKISEQENEIGNLKAEINRLTASQLEMDTTMEKIVQENSDLSENLAKAEQMRDEKQNELNNTKQQLQQAQLYSHINSNNKIPSNTTQSHAELLDSLNISEVNDITEMELLEQMLDQKLSFARTRKFNLHKQQLESIKEMIHCPICMAKNKTVALTPCGHTFCGDCSKNIFIHKKCPICRKTTKGAQTFYL